MAVLVESPAKCHVGIQVHFAFVVGVTIIFESADGKKHCSLLGTDPISRPANISLPGQF